MQYKAGQKIGYITLIKDTGKRKNKGNIIWECQCVCGKVFERGSDSLWQSTHKKCMPSCGCKWSSKRNIGKIYGHDQNRIDKARKSLGQIDGTTMQGIDRKSMNKNNRSGFRGVCFTKGKWKAAITFRGKNPETKYFIHKEDAIAHRKYLEQKYFEPVIEEYKRRGGKE